MNEWMDEWMIGKDWMNQRMGKKECDHIRKECKGAWMNKWMNK